MIVVPASLRSDFIHMAGMTIHIALESTIHIVGIRTREDQTHQRRCPLSRVEWRIHPLASAKRYNPSSRKKANSGDHGRLMKVYQASLHGVLLIEPKAFEDERGFFLESYNERAMADIGIQHPFVQDSHAFAARDVLQGLHYQVQRPQGKLIRVVVGEILYVSVDLRKSSPTSGRWFGTVLSGINKRMLWIPPGFAHGFVVLSDGAHVLTKATEFDRPELERTVAWNDPHLDIEWALKGHPIVSNKEKRGVPLRQAEMFD